MLLDHLATVINPDNEEDLHFLWGVSYCSILPSAWVARLCQEIATLLATGPVFDALFAREQDAQATRSALQAWASHHAKQLNPKTVLNSRETHLKRWIGGRLQGASFNHPDPDSEEEYQKVLFGYSLQICSTALGDEIEIIDDIYSSETFDYLERGWVYPETVERKLGLAIGQNSGWAANPTLLDPVTWKWLVHYGCCPFLSFIPFSQQALKFATSRFSAGDSKPLTEACLMELKSLVQGRQACTVLMRFWCSDALRLVTYGAFSDDSYSSIDTSNLADNVGLLNILVLCQPLLRKHLRATLRTTSITWATSKAKTLRQYLKLSLGADLKLLPTLLGVRLLNDPEFGRETPRRGVPGSHMSWDTFIWAPVPVSPAFMSSLDVQIEGTPAPSSESLVEGLRQIAAVCISPGTGVRAGVIRNNVCGARERCGLRLSTSLTLLWVLRGLSERCGSIMIMKFPVGTWWETMANHLAKLCNIPEDALLQWNALCCWCFGALGEREDKNGNPAQGNIPYVVHYTPNLIAEMDALLSSRSTPHNALLVVDLSSAEALADALSDAMGGKKIAHLEKGDVPGMRQFDCIGFDIKSRTVSLLIPPGFHPRDMLMLRDLATGSPSLRVSTDTTNLRDVKDITPFEVPPPPRLADHNWQEVSYRAVRVNVRDGSSFKTMAPQGLQGECEKNKKIKAKILLHKALIDALFKNIELSYCFHVFFL